MPSEITRVLESLTAVRALPSAASFIWTHVLNMTFQVAFICEDLAAFVTCVALIILGMRKQTHQVKIK